MSDVAAAPEVAQAPAAQALSPESMASIKSALEQALQKAYFGFIEHCRALPVHIGMMQKAFGHLDDGLFCLERAIRMIESLPLPAPVEECAAVADSAVEAVEAVTDAVEAVVEPEAAPAPAEGEAEPAA